MSVDEEYLQKVLRTVSHDMSSALRAAVGFSKLIASNYGDQLDDKALHWLSLMKEEGEQSQRRLVDFSRYARLYGIKEEPRTCDLLVLAQEAILECQQKYPDFSVEITAPLPSLNGYKNLWLLYFDEMLSNSARHAGSSVGCVISSSPVAEKSGKAGLVALVVEDRGCGISVNRMEAALSPYRTLDDRSDAGLGMGFSIAKRIVEIHDGEFLVENIVDGGNVEQPAGLRVTALLPSSGVIE